MRRKLQGMKVGAIRAGRVASLAACVRVSVTVGRERCFSRPRQVHGLLY